MRRPSLFSYVGTSCVLLILLVYSCKKKSITEVPPPPVSVADSNFKIVPTKIDINDFDVNYEINAPASESYSNVYIQWSPASDFSTIRDSALISPSINTKVSGKISIKSLHQYTRYFCRINLLYKNAKINSPAAEFQTDSLKIISYPLYINKNGFHSITTNFQPSLIVDTGTKIWLDNIPCSIQSTNGQVSSFIAPSNLVSKKYALKFQRNGINTNAPDSVSVLFGSWSILAGPPVPLHPSFPDNAIGFYGTCFSNNKGYVLPGSYYHDIPYGDPNFGRPGFILEFDFSTRQWTKRAPLNPLYFENPICYYYNNSIYVIGGTRVDMYNGNLGRLQKMLRLDLGTWTWTELDSLPYPSLFNLVSFEINNEWYIGLGADANNVSPCCGLPLPSNKFWKYNPSNNVWTTLPDMPRNHEGINQNFPTGFSMNNMGYVFYGAIPIGDPQSIVFRQEFWNYDPSINSWKQITLPASGAPSQGERYSIVSYNGRAYFLTAQRRELFSYYYGYALKDVYLQYDPGNNSFSKMSNPLNSTIMKPIGGSGNKFYFQADAVGYLDYIHNTTFELKLE